MREGIDTPPPTSDGGHIPPSFHHSKYTWMADGPLHDYYGAVMHDHGTRWHQWFVVVQFSSCMVQNAGYVYWIVTLGKLNVLGTLVRQKQVPLFTFTAKLSILLLTAESCG